MSRTDKTDPYRVKAQRHGVPQHDHRNGPCDLDRPDPERSPSRCDLVGDWHNPLFRCPCWLCHSSGVDPRAERRRGRRLARTEDRED